MGFLLGFQPPESPRGHGFPSKRVHAEISELLDALFCSRLRIRPVTVTLRHSTPRGKEGYHQHLYLGTSQCSLVGTPAKRKSSQARHLCTQRGDKFSLGSYNTVALLASEWCDTSTSASRLRGASPTRVPSAPYFGTSPLFKPRNLDCDYEHQVANWIARRVSRARLRKVQSSPSAV